MNKYVLATNVGVILILISCLGSSASAQPMTQSANTSMSGSTNATTSIGSTNLTLSQAAQPPFFCLIRGPAPGGQVCITHISTIPPLIFNGSTIGFEAGVFNDSPHPITVGRACQAPITAIFDTHYVITKRGFCNLFAPPKVISPYGDDTVYGPPATQIYQAIRSTGLLPNHTFAVITFTYHFGSTLTGPTAHIIFSYPGGIRILP